MKIISSAKYRKYIQILNEGEATLRALDKQTQYKEEYKKELESFKKRFQNRVEQYDKKILNMQEDHTIIIDRKDAELDVKISNATKDLKEKLDKTTMERNDYKKESEILKKAFENLGFDVKDMKSILNKLVDGIVSKNSIQMIKSS